MSVPSHLPALLRLMQLVSPALPVGAFNFSQGMEFAVEKRWIHDEPTALSWIGGIGRHVIGTLDLPVLMRLQAAWQADRSDEVQRWSRFLIASRETAELRAEDRHMGRSLAKVLADLDVQPAGEWLRRDDTAFATLFALAAARWDIAVEDAAAGYAWTWAENQVLAAVKLIPLGQSAGQRLLDRLITEVPGMVVAARQLEEEDIGVSAPLQGMASAYHEVQYTRLFRS